MSYVPLRLPADIEPELQAFVTHRVEGYLREAHDLLGMSVPERERGQRQFHSAVSLLLLSTVGGISKILHAPGRDRDAEKFKGVLKKWYPWDLDAPEGITADEAGSVLYEVFRCPLVHSLGIEKNDGRKIKLGLLEFAADENAAAHIVDIVRARERPNKPSIVYSSEKTVLWLHSFYWGVRLMIEQMLEDECVRQCGLDELRRLYGS